MRRVMFVVLLLTAVALLLPLFAAGGCQDLTTTAASGEPASAGSDQTTTTTGMPESTSTLSGPPTTAATSTTEKPATPSPPPQGQTPNNPPPAPPAPPVVTGLTPTSCAIDAQGAQVVITGTGFTGVSGVTFGGAPAMDFHADSATQITAHAPVHGPGTVNVRVTTPGGTSQNTAADDFTYVDSSQTSFPPMIATVINHYEESDPHLSWTGAWFPVQNANDSGGYVMRATQPASVTIRFSGERVSLIGEMHEYAGWATVTLDNHGPVNIDFYSPGPLYKQVIWESGSLSPGDHVVTMEWSANQNPASQGTTISLDLVAVFGGTLQ